LAALAAENEGHQVTLFLDRNGINILNCKKAGEIVGKGTGDLNELLENLKNSNVTIYVSEMSAKPKSYNNMLLHGYKAEFAMPNVQIEESIKAYSVLCY